MYHIYLWTSKGWAFLTNRETLSAAQAVALWHADDTGVIVNDDRGEIVFRVSPEQWR